MDLNIVLEVLTELSEDTTVPKNVKEKINSIVSSLNNKDEDVAISVNKVLHELEGIADDINLQSYTRTQVWNVISMLEEIQ